MDFSITIRPPHGSYYHIRIFHKRCQEKTGYAHQKLLQVVSYQNTIFI